MLKHIRECVRICEAGGLTDLKILRSGKRLKIGSAQGMIVFPSTPSDYLWRYKSAHNVRHLLSNC